MINERVQGCIADTLTISPFISKPSRQLADSCQTVNYLFIKILQRKTRQSDSFSEILVFTKNQRYLQLLLIFTNLSPNRSVVMACLDFSLLEEWILFGLKRQLCVLQIIIYLRSKVF